MFRFNKTIIREPTVCASLKLQYWRQLQILRYRTVRSYGDRIRRHTTEQFYNEVFLTDGNAKHTL